MGNYLLSLRVPPDENERNHPLYYDWSLPKRGLFRDENSSKLEDKTPKSTIDEHDKGGKKLVEDLVEEKLAKIVKSKLSNATKTDTTKSKIPKSIVLAAKKSSTPTTKNENAMSSSSESTDRDKKYPNLEQDREVTKTTASRSTAKSTAKSRS